MPETPTLHRQSQIASTGRRYSATRLQPNQQGWRSNNRREYYYGDNRNQVGILHFDDDKGTKPQNAKRRHQEEVRTSATTAEIWQERGLREAREQAQEFARSVAAEEAEFAQEFAAEEAAEQAAIDQAYNQRDQLEHERLPDYVFTADETELLARLQEIADKRVLVSMTDDSGDDVSIGTINLGDSDDQTLTLAHGYTGEFGQFQLDSNADMKIWILDTNQQLCADQQAA